MSNPFEDLKGIDRLRLDFIAAAEKLGYSAKVTTAPRKPVRTEVTVGIGEVRKPATDEAVLDALTKALQQHAAKMGYNSKVSIELAGYEEPGRTSIWQEWVNAHARRN